MSLHTAVAHQNEVSDLQIQIEKYSDKVKEMTNYASKFEIHSREDVNDALKYAIEARALSKRIELVRKHITEPARKFISSINDTAKQFTEKLEEIEDCMTSKIDDWKDLQRDKQEIFALMEWNTNPEDLSNLSTNGVTSYEKVEYKFELLDIEKVPRHYLKVDEKQVEIMMKAGITKVDGLKIWTERKTILRTK